MVYKMIFKVNTFKRSQRIERNMLSRKIICGKGYLFLLKSFVFSTYILLLAFSVKIVSLYEILRIAKA